MVRYSAALVSRPFRAGLLVLLFCLAAFVHAQGLDTDSEEPVYPRFEQSRNNSGHSSGLVFSFSGFNQFRLGLGIFFGSLGTDGGHHPFGKDFGLLFEYNFRDNIQYTRAYFHFTGGVSAFLLGASLVIVSDYTDISVGFSPEAGVGLSTVFKIFYRYNFFMDRKFNSYEVVFHLCVDAGRFTRARVKR